MVQKMHNLDDGVNEYFDFTVKGHTFRFRHMTMDEIEKMKEFENDEKKSREYLFGFISKVDETSPEFVEVSKQMTAPHWIRFREMIKAEFSG